MAVRATPKAGEPIDESTAEFQSGLRTVWKSSLRWFLRRSVILPWATRHKKKEWSKAGKDDDIKHLPAIVVADDDEVWSTVSHASPKKGAFGDDDEETGSSTGKSETEPTKVEMIVDSH